MADDAAVAQGDAVGSKVFISYSRKDVSFVDRLETALTSRGFNRWSTGPKYMPLKIGGNASNR